MVSMPALCSRGRYSIFQGSSLQKILENIVLKNDRQCLCFQDMQTQKRSIEDYLPILHWFVYCQSNFVGIQNPQRFYWYHVSYWVMGIRLWYCNSLNKLFWKKLIWVTNLFPTLTVKDIFLGFPALLTLHNTGLCMSWQTVGVSLWELKGSPRIWILASSSKHSLNGKDIPQNN